MKIFVIAGEQSGDMHASAIIQELYALKPDIEISGWGGDRMEKAGMTSLLHIDQLSVMGFSDVIKRAFFFIKLLTLCKRQILEFTPDVLLLVDYSGFNLRIAKWAKKQGVKVHYFIAPKTWAWRERRNKMIAQKVDFLHCIFPFEESYFRMQGINAHYVGNPLMNIKERHEGGDKKTIAILPGSRMQELKKVLPIIGDLISSVSESNFVISKVAHIEEQEYQRFLNIDSLYNVKFSDRPSQEILAYSSMAIITSGTATLEAAIIGCPQVVMYKTSTLNYWIGKRFLKTKFISLPNILLKQKVVEEVIQNDLTSNVLKKAIDHLSKEDIWQYQKDNYLKVKNLLGHQCPSKRVANCIIKGRENKF